MCNLVSDDNYCPDAPWRWARGFHRVFVDVLVGMDEFDVMMVVVLRFNERINARDLEGLVSEWRVYEDTPENRRKIGFE